MKKITLLGTTLLSTVCFLTSTTSFGQAGSLDLTFGTSGINITSVEAFNDEARSVALQSDGKIIVVGHSSDGAQTDFAVVRYNTDGSLDNSFDTDGKLITDINGDKNDEAYSVAIQSDGKIVVAGFTFVGGSDYNFALVRYNSDGTLDNSFDTDGLVMTDIWGSIDIAYSIAIQPDGKIIAAGYSFNGGANDFAVVRYNTDGSLDTSFDTDGMVTTQIGSSVDMGYSIALQSDGKIVVAGNSLTSGSDYNFAVVRYNSDGSLDTSFDADGKVVTPITGGSEEDKGYAVAIQSDGKIVVAGSTLAGTNYSYALIRYNPNGSLDNSFDSDGIVITSIGGSSGMAYSIAIQTDGRIVTAGYSFNGSSDAFTILRYNTDGNLDNSFNSNGIVATQVGLSTETGYAVTIQNDGQILVAGSSLNGSYNDFAVVRYNGDGVGLTSINTENTDIMLYPNPVTYNLTISTTESTEISICTINGIEILNTKVDKEQLIDLTNFASGVYFVITSGGQTVKFIKE